MGTQKITNFGGEGSGNFDHEGRPGEIGGSGAGGNSEISHPEQTSRDAEKALQIIQQQKIQQETEKNIQKVKDELARENEYKNKIKSEAEKNSLNKPILYDNKAMSIAKDLVRKDGLPNNKTTLDKVKETWDNLGDLKTFRMQDVGVKDILTRIGVIGGVDKILSNTPLIQALNNGDNTKAYEALDKNFVYKNLSLSKELLRSPKPSWS